MEKLRGLHTHGGLTIHVLSLLFKAHNNGMSINVVIHNDRQNAGGDGSRGDFNTFWKLGSECKMLIE